MGIFWPMVASAAISAGGNILGGMLGRGDEGSDPWGEGELARQLPDYPEAEGARGEWWKRLQEWGGQPGYGAIAPNWEDIWNRAKQKLTQYYWGSTLDPGLAGKVRASAARRNVSQSPALENMLTAMGFQEAQDVGNLAGIQAEKEAEFGERGRMNWLQSLMSLTGQKPAFVTRTGVASGSGQGYGAGEMVGDVSSGLGSLFSQYAQYKWLQDKNQQDRDWMSKLFSQAGGTGGQTLSSSYGAAKPMNYGDNIFSTGLKFPEPGSY